MKRVVVGLSGGVDSSVAAYLLKEQGYEVIGLFMKNWHDDSVTISNECPWLEDSNDAMLVAEKLGIPFQTVDLSKEYKKRIVDYMFNEYALGRTPNPDILCNREIKFDVFMNIALNLGADYVATGHYCRKKSFKKNGVQIYQLFAGQDDTKDQSYFLCQLSQIQLSTTLFPLGSLLKSEVRRIAQKENLITAEKRDSQGLCFIGKVKLPEFLQEATIESVLEEEVYAPTFEGQRDRMVLEFLYLTGVRLSELTALKWKDIQLFDEQVKVLGKRQKERIIPLTKSLISHITDYKNIVEAHFNSLVNG